MIKLQKIFQFFILCCTLLFSGVGLAEIVHNKKQEIKQMKIEIDGQRFDVLLDDNVTSRDIVKNLPFEVHMENYGGHEYTASLPFEPQDDNNKTSKLKAFHIYYWAGWNSFVINYKDYDIAPYKSVHIGTIEGAKELLNGQKRSIVVKAVKE